MGNPAIYNQITGAHANHVRVSIDLSATFPNSASLTDASQQNWSAFDALMGNVQSLGLHPLILLNSSTPWLEPSPNPCSSIGAPLTNVLPTNVNQWGKMAALVVAHMDHNFTSVQPDYEIWNEPDGTTFMCIDASDPNPDQTRLNDWDTDLWHCSPAHEAAGYN